MFLIIVYYKNLNSNGVRFHCFPFSILYAMGLETTQQQMLYQECFTDRKGDSLPIFKRFRDIIQNKKLLPLRFAEYSSLLNTENVSSSLDSSFVH